MPRNFILKIKCKNIWRYYDENTRTIKGGAIRNLAKEKGIHAQEVLQIFMFERIIERLSISPYKDKFILKGGLLISAILGVAERTTMDMDTTIKGLPMEEKLLKK